MAAAATTPPLNEGQQNGDYPSQVDDANSDTSSKLIIANDLQNEDQKRLFDAIDALRDHGVGSFTNGLPELIVCGVQSAGKSSVMEAISGVPFPRHVTVCTRYATEIVLRRDSIKSISVSIIPASYRSNEDQAKLAGFRYELQSYEDFPELFRKASDAMGVNSDSPRGFSQDKLKVEIRGPQQPQLTLVDLPGLIVSGDKQDIKLVDDLVSSHMRNPRSIILAVILATTDHNNQIALTRARKYDPEGKRTLGILTKPDMLEYSAAKEEPWLELVRNKSKDQRYVFELGWHVLRNIDSGRTEKFEDRDRLESEYFTISSFKRYESPKLGVGIAKLRGRLSEILFRHIRQDLPSVIQEIKEGIQRSKSSLEKLGRARPDMRDQRSFLTELSLNFRDLSREAIKGSYDDPFFSFEKGEASTETRLCARLLDAHDKFAQEIEVYGSEWAKKTRQGQRNPERDEMIKMTKEFLQQNRGRELPGHINPDVVGKLFFRFRERWRDLAEDHIEEAYQMICRFLKVLLASLADDDICGRLYWQYIHPKLEAMLAEANLELNKILAVYEKQPMTTSPLFHRRIQELHLKKVSDIFRQGFDKRFPDGFEITKDNLDEFLEDLQEGAIGRGQMARGQIDDFTAEITLDTVLAFYDTAAQAFVENVPTLAIWLPIVHTLPEIFDPRSIINMDDQLVASIARESEEKLHEREQLSKKLAALKNGDRVCKGYATYANKTGSLGLFGEHASTALNGTTSAKSTDTNGLRNTERRAIATTSITLPTHEVTANDGSRSSASLNSSQRPRSSSPLRDPGLPSRPASGATPITSSTTTLPSSSGGFTSNSGEVRAPVSSTTPHPQSTRSVGSAAPQTTGVLRSTAPQSTTRFGSIAPPSSAVSENLTPQKSSGALGKTNPQSTSAFGSTPPQKSSTAFGSTTSYSTPVFGSTTPLNSSGGLFRTPSTTSGSIFGSAGFANTPTAQPSVFGGPVSSSKPGSFAGTSSTTTSGLFSFASVAQNNNAAPSSNSNPFAVSK